MDEGVLTEGTVLNLLADDEPEGVDVTVGVVVAEWVVEEFVDAELAGVSTAR